MGSIEGEERVLWGYALGPIGALTLDKVRREEKKDRRGGGTVCVCVVEWGCLWNQFKCKNRCLDRTLVCDGIQHCNEGEDETDCGTYCIYLHSVIIARVLVLCH